MRTLIFFSALIITFFSCQKIEDLDHLKSCGDHQIFWDGEKFVSDPDENCDIKNDNGNGYKYGHCKDGDPHTNWRWKHKNGQELLKSDEITTAGCVDTADLECISVNIDDLNNIEIEKLTEIEIQTYIDTLKLPSWNTDEIKYYQDTDIDVYYLINNFNQDIQLKVNNTVFTSLINTEITLHNSTDLLVKEEDFEMVDSLFEQEQADTFLLEIIIPSDPRKEKQILRVITKKFKQETFETYYNILSIEGKEGRGHEYEKESKFNKGSFIIDSVEYTYMVKNNGELVVYLDDKKMRNASIEITYLNGHEYIKLDFDDYYNFSK